MAHAVRLILVSVWRLAIVVVAVKGTYGYVERGWDNLSYFTEQSNLIVALYYAWALLFPLFTGGRRLEPRSGGVRGAVVVYIVVTGLIYNTVMNGPLTRPEHVLTHVVAPLLVVADWLVVGRNQAALRWWHPFAWLTYPIGYFVFYLVRASQVETNKYLYVFLNPDRYNLAAVVLGFLALFTVLGYVLVGTGWIRRAVLATRTQPATLPATAPPATQSLF